MPIMATQLQSQQTQSPQTQGQNPAQGQGQGQAQGQAQSRQSQASSQAAQQGWGAGAARQNLYQNASQGQSQSQNQSLTPWNWFRNDLTQPQNSSTATSLLQPFFSISRDIEDIFTSFFRNANVMTQNFANMNVTPRLDIEETDNEYVIVADAPGLDEQNLDVQIANHILVLTGERESIRESQQKRSRMHSVERSYGAFRRVLTLPQDVDENRAEANYRNGVLTITIPRQQHGEGQQVKHVQVNKAA
jgi:HSP20 family protein